MPITEEQLATIKAANHAKSKAWEEERFLTGDRVRLYWSYFAKRLATNTWLDEKTNIEYETLSRWARTCLNRPSTTIKNCAIMLAYPGATHGTYKLINHLPLKEMREHHMLPANPVEAPMPTPPAPAPAPTTTSDISNYLSFEELRDYINTMLRIIDIDNKDKPIRQASAVIELTGWLIDHSENVHHILKEKVKIPSWWSSVCTFIRACSYELHEQLEDEILQDNMHGNIDLFFEKFENY